jgi:hypothetical protein
MMSDESKSIEVRSDERMAIGFQFIVHRSAFIVSFSALTLTQGVVTLL